MKAGIYLDPIGNLIYVAKDRTIKAMSCDDFGVRKVGAKVSHRAKDDTVQIEGTDYRCSRFADVPNGCTDHRNFLGRLYAQRFIDDVSMSSEELIDSIIRFFETPDYQKWIDLGRSIYEATEGSYAGRDLWTRVSEQRPGFDPNKIAGTWSGFIGYRALPTPSELRADIGYSEPVGRHNPVDLVTVDGREVSFGERTEGRPAALAAPYGGNDAGWYAEALAATRPRAVGKQSARKHRKKGRRVWWDAERNTRVWAPA